jgi:hypothetical protein
MLLSPLLLFNQLTFYFLGLGFGCFDRAKVKNGLKIISTQTTNPAWSLSFDVNGKHIAAAVSAVRNFSVSTQPHQPRFVSVCVCRRGIVVVVLCFVFYCCCCCTTTLWGFHSHFRLFISDLFSILSTFPFSLSFHLVLQDSQELFTWLLAVNVDHHRDSSELGDGVRALWSWTIRTHSASPPLPSSISGHHHHTNNNNKEGQLDEVKGKLTSRFEVLKDEVQSVFPIIKVTAIHFETETN